MTKTTLWLVDFDIKVPESEGKRESKRESRRVLFYVQAKKIFGDYRYSSTYSCWGFKDENVARTCFRFVRLHTKKCNLYKAVKAL